MRKDKTPVFYWIFAAACILFGIMSIAYPLINHSGIQALHICILFIWLGLAYRELYCYYLFFVKPRREKGTGADMRGGCASDNQAGASVGGPHAEGQEGSA